MCDWSQGFFTIHHSFLCGGVAFFYFYTKYNSMLIMWCGCVSERKRSAPSVCVWRHGALWLGQWSSCPPAPALCPVGHVALCLSSRAGSSLTRPVDAENIWSSINMLHVSVPVDRVAVTTTSLCCVAAVNFSFIRYWHIWLRWYSCS